MSRWKADSPLDLALALALVLLDAIAARATDPVAAAARKARAILDAGMADEAAQVDLEAREEEEAAQAEGEDREVEAESRADWEAREEARAEEDRLDQEVRDAGWKDGRRDSARSPLEEYR